MTIGFVNSKRRKATTTLRWLRPLHMTGWRGLRDVEEVWEVTDLPNLNWFQEHLFPLVGNMIDLGGSLLRWRKIWTGDLDISGTGTASRTPTAGTDIANKTYVDNQTLGTINITVEEVDGAPSIVNSPT